MGNSDWPTPAAPTPEQGQSKTRPQQRNKGALGRVWDWNIEHSLYTRHQRKRQRTPSPSVPAPDSPIHATLSRRSAVPAPPTGPPKAPMPEATRIERDVPPPSAEPIPTQQVSQATLTREPTVAQVNPREAPHESVPIEEPQTEAATNEPYGFRDVRCPVCGKDDAIQRISAIADSGTTSGTGTASTTSVNWSTRGGVGIGSASTTFNVSSETQLAHRLKLPTRPEALVGWIALGFFVFGSGSMWLLEKAFGYNVLAGLFSFGIGAIGGAAIYGARQSSIDASPKGKAWAEAAAMARSSYYCFRDDVAFLPGGSAKSPEALVRDCFVQSHFLQ